MQSVNSSRNPDRRVAQTHSTRKEQNSQARTHGVSDSLTLRLTTAERTHRQEQNDGNVFIWGQATDDSYLHKLVRPGDIHCL